MKSLSFVIVISCAMCAAGGSREQFDESAWMDNTARDKYFEYAELTESAYFDSYNYSNNVDSLEFQATTKSRVRMRRSSWSNRWLRLSSQPARRHISQSNQKPKVINFFLNAIKKVVNTNQRQTVRPKNETNKGLDIRLETSNPHFPPTFGNHQDLQLIYLGTKW